MLVLSAIWGSSFLFIKVGVSELHPLYVALGRVASGAAVLLLILLATQSRLPSDLWAWGHNAVVAIIGVAMPFTLFGYGEQRVSSILAGIWNSVTPLVVLPLAVIAFRTEQMSIRRLVGLVLGFIGAMIILGIWQGVGGSSFTGQMLCLAAASCYGIAIPYTRKFLSHRQESGIVLSAVQLIIACAVLALVAPLLGAPLPRLGELSWQVIASVTTLGAVGTGIAFVLHLRNIRLVGATTASMVTYIVPIFATVIGAVVLSERVAWFQPIGAAIVLLGVAVAQGVRLKRAPVADSRAESA
jgi:drug/metabolite transporter (DMT)-like permease